MTEHEWLTCEKPKVMRRALGKSVTNRKMQLLLCGIFRIFWDTLPYDDFRHAVVRKEQALDDSSIDDDPQQADTLRHEPAYHEHHLTTPNFGMIVRQLFHATLNYEPKNGFRAAIEWGGELFCLSIGAREREATLTTFHRLVCDLFRELFPPPPRDYRVLPAFAGGGVLLPSGQTFPVPDTALAVAKGVQADQAFDRLPILADALEDANCPDRPWLDHLRHGTTHRRGCWALDLVLGKG